MLVLERKVGEGFIVGSFQLWVERIDHGLVDFSVRGDSFEYRVCGVSVGVRFWLAPTIGIMSSDVSPERVKVGFEAPRDINIVRWELAVSVEEQPQAGGPDDHRPGS